MGGALVVEEVQEPDVVALVADQEVLALAEEVLALAEEVVALADKEVVPVAEFVELEKLQLEEEGLPEIAALAAPALLILQDLEQGSGRGRGGFSPAEMTRQRRTTTTSVALLAS